jgi:small conductance mechanosensitive channel
MIRPAQTDIADRVTTSNITGSDLLIAAIVMVVAWVVSRFARRAVVDLLGRLEGVSEDMRQLAGRLTKYFVLLIGVGVALTFLGAPIQPLLSAAIIVAVVAALALRGIADNFAAGVVIQTRRPIQLGDHVEALGHAGIVRQLNGRSVVIETADGKMVHLPNAKVLDSPIVNSSTSAARQGEVEVRSAGVDDVDGTVDAVIAATASVPGVLAEPAPVMLLQQIEPKQLTALVHFWHGPDSGPSVVSAVVRGIAEAERRRGVVTTVLASSPGSKPSSAGSTS